MDDEGAAAGNAAEQISEEIGRKLSELESLLGPAPEFDVLRARAETAGRVMDAQLRSGDDKLAAQTAIDLAGLLPDQVPGEWWGTPLGRLVAQSVGWPGAEALSLSQAAAVLRVSRTRAQQFAREGRLERHPDGGVTAVSVAMLAKERGEAA